MKETSILYYKAALEVRGVTRCSAHIAQQIADDWRREYEEGLSKALYGVRKANTSDPFEYEAYLIERRERK